MKALTSVEGVPRGGTAASRRSCRAWLFGTGLSRREEQRPGRPGGGAMEVFRRMSEVEVSGLRVGYEREGTGPPLVLLHGGFGFDSRSWRRQMDALSDQYTVVAWDAPGCGRSSDPPPTFRLPDYADCLAGFIGALGLSRPHVLGLSFGGALALQLFGQHPAVPRTLILAGAYAGWAGSLPPD